MFLCFHIKIQVPIWDELEKNLTLKAKHEVKIKIFTWLLFYSPTLLPCYPLAYLCK